MFKFRVQHPVFVLISLLMILISCAPPPPYTPSFRVKMEALDFSPVKGRRIVIDPGHGGRFIGAVGMQGLRESDINLAVGLHLWGLLKQAGAEVIMTRSADVDLCPSGSAALGDDLMARARLSNNFKADLFISIHHNSNTYDRKKNETQIYYKLMDPGASQDLAICVAQELKRGESLAEVFVFPGNYRVLRNTQALAILGEASFISNKENEKRLTLANQLRREAEDYFLGILTYFQKGIPELSDYQPNNGTLHNAFPQIRAKIVGGKEGKAIDPKTPQLYLDGVLVPASFDPKTEIITYRPDKPIKNGWHTFSAQARNLNGNASWINPVRFCISLPAAKVMVSSAFSSLPADGKSSTCIRVEVLDRYDNPVIDDTVIEVKTFAGKLDRRVANTVNGRVIASFVPPRRPEEALIEARCEAISGKTIIKCGPINDALMRISINDINQKPLDMVTVRGGDILLGVSNEEGLVFIKTHEAEKSSITLSKPGYETQERAIVFTKGVLKEETFILTPKEDGFLLGKKIILDPEPWDEKTEKIFGLTADYEQANLLVAQKLQAVLEEAGAITLLTRNSLKEHPTPGDRVSAGEKFGGEYFITITHRKGTSYAAHYFLSQPGKKLAQAIANAMKRELKFENVKVREGLDFTIIHPSSTSVLINFGEKHLSKEKKIAEQTIEQEARCVYQGLVEFLKNKKERIRNSLRKIDE
jgi:N-acetylmuramoyl-L-alanine amidase